jgi:hypothetical protein
VSLVGYPDVTGDRLCVVVSGTWWCNSGPDFDPAKCVSVPAEVTPGASPAHLTTMA